MDVMEWSLGQATAHMVEESLRAEDMGAALRTFILFAVDNADIMGNIMQSQRRRQFEELFIASVEAYLRELVRHRPSDIPVSYTDMEIILRYSACGIAGVLLTYAEKADPGTEHLAQLIECILKRAVGVV